MTNSTILRASEWRRIAIKLCHCHFCRHWDYDIVALERDVNGVLVGVKLQRTNHPNETIYFDLRG